MAGFIKIACLLLLTAFLFACSVSAASQPVPLARTPRTEANQNLPLNAPGTPTLYNSAPDDPTLDRNCRQTINFFFSFRKDFDVQAYRGLFAQSAQSLADAGANNPPPEPLTILVLMPVSAWWQRNYPGTPIPGLYLPEEAGEYIYYVEYTGHYQLYETPVVVYPDFMTMVMVQEGSSKDCKIKNYGKG
jgi:hypothetical protein